MPTLHKAEGITLKAINFKEYDRILTLYTKESGLIKLIVKGARRPRNANRILTEPLVEGEFIYSTGKSELYRFHDGTLLKTHLSLRKQEHTLTAACEITKKILATQFPGRVTQPLYLLYRYCLEHLPHLSPTATAALTTAFYLKLLHFEGLLHPTPSCVTCHVVLSGKQMLRRGSYCLEHAPLGASEFSRDEIHLLVELMTNRDLDRLEGVGSCMTEEFVKKVLILFESAIRA
jgi:DNA repair protein RecO (recombination protein O)